MNQKDRNRMARLYSCLKFPWPNRNRTIGPRDLSRFFHRIEIIQPRLMDCVLAIARSDDPEEDPDFELSELEKILTQFRVEDDEREIK